MFFCPSPGWLGKLLVWVFELTSNQGFYRSPWQGPGWSEVPPPGLTVAVKYPWTAFRSHSAWAGPSYAELVEAGKKLDHEEAVRVIQERWEFFEIGWRLWVESFEESLWDYFCELRLFLTNGCNPFEGYCCFLIQKSNDFYFSDIKSCFS